MVSFTSVLTFLPATAHSPAPGPRPAPAVGELTPAAPTEERCRRVPQPLFFAGPRWPKAGILAPAVRAQDTPFPPIDANMLHTPGACPGRLATGPPDISQTEMPPGRGFATAMKARRSACISRTTGAVTDGAPTSDGASLLSAAAGGPEAPTAQQTMMRLSRATARASALRFCLPSASIYV